MRTIRYLVLLILIVGGVWYFTGKRGGQSSSSEAPPAQESAPAQATQDTATADKEGMKEGTAEAPTEAPASGTARVHYFTASALEACSTETVALTQTIDPQYGHPTAGALVAMTRPLPTDAPKDTINAFAAGTRLIRSRLDRDGIIHVDYNRNLNDGLEGCRAAQRRAQIVNTAKEFPAVKEVVVTVNGSTWAY